MAVHADDGYEWALARVSELEVDLASAIPALERACEDNAALKEIHSDLTNAYKRLQKQHDLLCVQLRQEQEERQQVIEEQQHQIALWRTQLEVKARDLEEMQAKMSPGELEAMRMRLTEEIGEPYMQQLRSLEQQLNAEHRRAGQLQRQLELQRREFAQRESEFEEEKDGLRRAQRQREQTLEQKVANLEAELRKLAEVEAACMQAKGHLQEEENKVLSLQRALKEQELQSERERGAALEELKAKIKEVSTLRSRAHEVQVQLDAQERSGSRVAAEAEAARRECTRLAAQLEQAEMKLQASAKQRSSAAAAPAAGGEEAEQLRQELSRQRAAALAEREALGRAAKAAEERAESAGLELRRAEATVRQLQEERVDQEAESREAREELERRLAAENASLRAQLDAAAGDAEVRNMTWREREAGLVRQVEDTAGRLEAVTGELFQCQVVQEDLDRRLQDSQAGFEHRLQELQAEAERKAQELHAEAERRAQELQSAHALQLQEAQQRLQEAQQRLQDASLQAQRELADARQQAQQQVEALSKQAEDARREAQDIQLQAQLQAQQQTQQSAQESGALREQVARLERERDVQDADLRGLREKLEAQQQRCSALEVELVQLRSTLDTERVKWAREADETCKTMLQAEEQRRSAVGLQMAEEHKRQLAKFQAASRKALQKAARKRQILRSQCQELAKRVELCKQREATAVRVATENKASYEMRLAELSAPQYGIAQPQTLAHASAAGGPAHRRELQAISERLERHAEYLRSRPSAASAAAVEAPGARAGASEPAATMSQAPHRLPSPMREATSPTLLPSTKAPAAAIGGLRPTPMTMSTCSGMSSERGPE